ncbi:MAG: hypothetical protein Q8M26_12835 [Pseudolabrys sp.]|nr:hypothetical protein [Pseudolabrys sp.]
MLWLILFLLACGLFSAGFIAVARQGRRIWPYWLGGVAVICLGSLLFSSIFYARHSGEDAVNATALLTATLAVPATVALSVGAIVASAFRRLARRYPGR